MVRRWLKAGGFVLFVLFGEPMMMPASADPVAVESTINDTKEHSDPRDRMAMPTGMPEPEPPDNSDARMDKLWEAIAHRSTDIQTLLDKFSDNKPEGSRFVLHLSSKYICPLTSCDNKIEELKSKIGKLTETERLMVLSILWHKADEFVSAYRSYTGAVQETKSDEKRQSLVENASQARAIARNTLVQLAGKDAVKKLDRELKADL